MNQLFPVLSCLLLGLFSAYFHGSSAETYSIGSRSLVNCSKGTPVSAACSKKYLMFPFPRVGRSEGNEGFPRSQRVIGIVKQPRIGRSDPSLLQLQPDNQRMIYNADDQPDKAQLDYQRRALAQREDYSRSMDDYLSSRRSMSPWAFFLITPNFHNTEHAMDNLILPQLDHQLDNRDDNDE